MVFPFHLSTSFQMMESLRQYVRTTNTHPARANSLTLLILFTSVLSYSHFQNPVLTPLACSSSSPTWISASFTLLAFPVHCPTKGKCVKGRSLLRSFWDQKTIFPSSSQPFQNTKHRIPKFHPPRTQGQVNKKLSSSDIYGSNQQPTVHDT